MSEHSVPFRHPWRERMLGEVGSVTVGGTPSTSVPKYWHGDIPWMASGDVHLRVIDDVPIRISDLGLRHSAAKMVTPPSVAVALAGQGKTRGTAALVRCALCSNQSVALLKCNPDELDTGYLLQNLSFRYWELRSRSAGGGRAGLTKTILESFPVPLPDVPEQSKIAEVLSTLDRAIEQTEALIAKQQRIKTGLMQDLLTRGIDKHGNLRSKQTHEFKDSPLGRIPTEWSAATIGAYCTVKRGASPRPIQDPKWWGGEVGWVRISDVTASRKYLRTTTQRLSPMGVRRSVLLDPGEVIMSICATIGRPVITTYPVCIHDGFVWFDGLSSQIDREWFYYYLQSKEEELAGSRQVGTQGNLNTGIVSQTALLIPDDPDEQMRIARVLGATDKATDDWLAAQTKLLRLRAGLMQDLLTGNRRVTALLEPEEVST